MNGNLAMFGRAAVVLFCLILVGLESPYCLSWAVLACAWAFSLGGRLVLRDAAPGGDGGGT